jgi:hypothetical protein
MNENVGVAAGTTQQVQKKRIKLCGRIDNGTNTMNENVGVQNL